MEKRDRRGHERLRTVEWDRIQQKKEIGREKERQGEREWELEKKRRKKGAMA